MPNDSDLCKLLLSHHFSDEHEHCVQLRGRLICRRCLALWPLTVGLLILWLFWCPSQNTADTWLPLLALPATLEFVLERLKFVSYHPGRVVLVSILLAFPLGRGFSRYLQDPFDLWFWGLIALGGIPALLAVVWRWWNDARDS